MSVSLNESAVEQFALGALGELGYTASEGVRLDKLQERVHLSRAILSERLERAISRINPHLSHFLCRRRLVARKASTWSLAIDGFMLL